MPIEKVKGWFSPGTSPDERRPLLAQEGYFNEQSGAYTDIDDEAYASSSEFPAGYATHYATFPSIDEQKFSRQREQLLFHIMLGCFFASIVLLAIAGTLVATGKKKLRVEVDAAVLVGVLASLFFATLAIGTMLYRQQRLSWLHRGLVGLTLFGICLLNGVILVLVAGNTGH
jgi:multidrug transporter EmrE-like cation transporter